MIYLDIIAGARPNFMKIAPIIHEINKNYKDIIEYRLIHTGQHFDYKMSQTFFDELNIPKPHLNLNAGGGTQAQQTGAIMIGYEESLRNFKPNLCLVVGDVTSTLACSIVAKKAGIKVAHVEAGIRSGDMLMPEEINRLVTDSITDYFFTTSRIASENLLKNGICNSRIFFVGNTMIDTLYDNLDRLKEPEVFKVEDLKVSDYYVLTLHRPSNVDNVETLLEILKELNTLSANRKVIFPIHPRTFNILKEFEINFKNIIFIEPLGYLEFIYLVKNSFAVVTDSGGITEECTVLGIPCLTMRDTTERPETVEVGTNELIGSSSRNLKKYFDILNSGAWKKGTIPELWDGKTGKRIIELLNIQDI